MSFRDDLFVIHRDHLDKKDVKHKNRYNKYEYGYNSDLDCVIISSNGTVGDIYEVQGLRIGLPATPKQVWKSSDKTKDQIFVRTPKPTSLAKYKTIYDFQAETDGGLKEQYADYIEQEWERRENGFWFMCNGEPIYMTGEHYFFCNYHSIDTESGFPDFRHSNRIWFYFWEACKADHRCYGMCYLKNRRSGFSHMASSMSVNTASKTKRAHIGILSKTGADAK